jgi:ankyrin repeat protein
MPSKAKQRAAELALHQAIGGCEIAEVANLLKQNVDPNCVGQRFQKFPYAFTALCAAIQRAAEAVSPTRAAMDATLESAAKELGLKLAVDPLDKATARAYSLQVIQLLLSAGADPNRRGASRTPLSLAAGHYGDLELTRLLLDAGAHPDGAGCDVDGREVYCTALWEAASKGFYDVVALLRERGADTTIRNRFDRKTPLQIARKRGHARIVSLLERHEA